MKVKLGDEVKELKSVWIERDFTVKMIDQRYLPWKLEIFESKSYKATAWAIKEMVTRGAPSIGVAAAYAFVQAASETVGSKDFIGELKKKVSEIIETRPTAVNLKNAINIMWEKTVKLVKEGMKPKEIVDELFRFSNKIAEREIKANKAIGEFGEKLIKDGNKILTHCNTGGLATVDIGTALAPIIFAYRRGKKIFVFVDETRPRLQGARLTAWELLQEGVPHAIIADNAAGYYMWKGEIDLVIVGADRITMNGDVANKIGTYKLAVVAKENNIPFYVAAPITTFDRNLKTGRDIPIEERSEEEVLYVKGVIEDDRFSKIRIAPVGSKALNPAFDVTPAKYITGIITEVGILKTPQDISRALSKDIL
ncbi:MAG: S-methyl-5-thioribose-1-phosphate isomerase [Candidatus Njordarchaeia archaeon]